MSQAPILWTPSADFIEQSNLKAYEHWLRKEKGLSFDHYDQLWQWSVDHIEDFWESLWVYFEIISHSHYTSVLSSRDMPGARWFEGATLNYAEHIFRQKSTDRPALVFHSESGDEARVSWGELEAMTSSFQQYLRQHDIKTGDRVVAYLPNKVDTLAAFYAVNSLGAIWSCCSPDFGATTVIERFSQIEPRLFITTDGYVYGGKSFDRSEDIAQIRKALGSVEETVLIPSGVGSGLEGAVEWSQATAAQPQPLTFTPVAFDHPIWILFSSGTTGKPKAITHSHGGVLLEHLKYMTFHNDVHPGENFFWFTTTGWMMWNFLQASLLVGATAVLYDGSPGQPNLHRLWELAASLPIHHFGTSAPYLTACMKRGLEPGKEMDLSALRSIGSTGAPLPPEAFRWVYDAVSSDLWLCSMSGGTDVCTAFVGGCPYEPVYEGQIQGRALGCALMAYDDDGHAITGSLGEMVIEAPMPSMPVFFWNDPENQRYRDSYFDKFPGKWCHGDWINIAPNGSLNIQGRSDATLNRKGIRIGTAEIYSVLDGIEEIEESLILNLEKEDGGDVMPLFVVLKANKELDLDLKHKINDQLKEKCSPRHVPDMIIAASDIPFTLSGKKMEVPVKKILLGMSGGKALNKESVRNPAAIDYFKGIAGEFKEKYLT